MDGPLNEFVDQLEEAGFELMEREKDAALLIGDFAGYQECIIGVTATNGGKEVFGAAVVIGDQEHWADLSSDYFNLKKRLTSKYDHPTDHEEEFAGYEPPSDYLKMQAVEDQECNYYSTWELEDGEIELSITEDGVILRYWDKINYTLFMEEANGDL